LRNMKLNASMAFTVSLMATMVFCGLGRAQTAPLPYRPIDAEYSLALDRIVMVSASPNQLHIYEATTQTDLPVALAKAPTCVSVSPDGLHAAVGHDALISYVNLVTATVEKTLAVPSNVVHLVLSAEYVHIPSPSYGNLSVNLFTGSVTGSPGSGGQPGARLHPSGRAIYSTRDGTSPNDVERYDVSTGPITAVSDSPYHGDYPACGPVWFSPDGDRIYTGCGTVYRASAQQSQDMVYWSSLPGTTSVGGLSESAALDKIAAIPGGAVYPNPAPRDDEVRLFKSDFLQPVARFLLPPFSVGANAFSAHAKWVFFSADSSVIRVVMQADGASGLLHDFAVETIPLSNPPWCAVTLSAQSTAPIAEGGLAAIDITAEPGCQYQAVTSADWIQLAAGEYGSGSGTLTYLVRPNLDPDPRTGSISVGSQTLTVTQQGAAATGVPLARLSFRVVDAEYSKQLDRLILVSNTLNELHIYDPVSHADRIVPLPVAPLSVSVHPDGLYAAVGHDGWISYVNLQTAAIEQVYQVFTDVHDVVLAENGYIYAFPERDWSSIYSLSVATGTLASTTAIYDGRVARLHPNGAELYLGGNWESRWNISQGVAVLLTRYSTGFETCGNLWITEDGNRILTACGNNYRTPVLSNETPQYNGEVSYANSVRWATHSAQQQSTALIPANSSYPVQTTDTELQWYGDAFLGFGGRADLPYFPDGGASRAHGRFAFWNAAASEVIVIVQADASAQLMSDCAVVRVAPLPTLAISNTHIGDFYQGQVGAQFTITVSNVGTGALNGLVTVTDTLPAGLTATAMAGSGWDCVLGSRTCARSDGLATTSSYPEIRLTVNVAIDAPASVVNVATVTGGGTTENATADDTTAIRQPIAVTIGTIPAGLQIVVDGITLTAPHAFTWAEGSPHTISALSPQLSGGTRYWFAGWSDGGGQTHTIVTPATSGDYSASFTVQHYLTMLASVGGSVDPLSGYYNGGQSITIQPVPEAGWSFRGWTGSGSGSYSGPSSTAVITMNGPITERARFAALSKVGYYRSGAWLMDGNGNGVNDGTDRALLLGAAGMTPVTGDWNGDGRTEAAVYSGGFWFLDYNGNGVWDGGIVDKQIGWGWPGATPFVGDWNGDGKTEIGVYSGGFWFLDYNGDFLWDGGVIDKQVGWGWSGVTPFVGDWNGDGKTKIGVYSNGFWFLDYDGNYTWDGGTADKQIGWGWAGTMPIVGDWNGDGKAKLGTYIGGYWFVDYDGSYTWDGGTLDKIWALGWTGTTPVIGDWSGDGKDKAGAFIDGYWYLDYNGNGAWDGAGADRIYAFGQAGDAPVVGRW
jgi:uncharacterized repeat protein (TIGR01451 family)